MSQANASLEAFEDLRKALNCDICDNTLVVSSWDDILDHDSRVRKNLRFPKHDINDY